MAGDPKLPEVGELHIDASVCLPYAVDLPPGALSGLRSAHEGVDAVVAEVKANQTTWGDKAGVTAGDYDALVTSHSHIQEIDLYLGPARKLVEILEESRAKEVDARERAISAIAGSADLRASQPGNETVAAKYEATRTYRSEIAKKGAKTRAKNAEAAKAAQTAKAGNGNGATGTDTGNGATSTATSAPPTNGGTPGTGTPTP